MIKGSLVALITPFQENGDVDFEALKRLVEWHIEQGTDGFVCCGTTGEAPTLSDEEHHLIFKTVITTARKRVLVIAGTGTYDTRHSVARTREALELGADAALVITPYYNRPTLEGCKAHFTEIGRVGLPVIIYYNPGRTGGRFSAEQLATIAQSPSVVGIKDSSGTTHFIQELQQYTDLPIYSGDDIFTFAHLKAGAQGAVSVVGNIIPRQWKEMVQQCLSGNLAQAEELFNKLLPLCQSVGIETNPQGIKYAAHVMGLSTPYMRLPLIQPAESTQAKIREAISSLQELDLVGRSVL